VKWKGWADVFSSWEPRSNLDCNELISEFQTSGQKRSWQFDVAEAHDPLAKKRRIADVVDQLLIIDPQITPLRLIDLYKELDATKVD